MIYMRMKKIKYLLFTLPWRNRVGEESKLRRMWGPYDRTAHCNVLKKILTQERLWLLRIAAVRYKLFRTRSSSNHLKTVAKRGKEKVWNPRLNSQDRCVKMSHYNFQYSAANPKKPRNLNLYRYNQLGQSKLDLERGKLEKLVAFPLQQIDKNIKYNDTSFLGYFTRLLLFSS